MLELLSLSMALIQTRFMNRWRRCSLLVLCCVAFWMRNGVDRFGLAGVAVLVLAISILPSYSDGSTRKGYTWLHWGLADA